MYMLCALVGTLVVLLVTYMIAKHKGLDEVEMLYMMLFSGVGVFVFGHLLYAFTVPDRVWFVFSNFGNIKSFNDFVNLINFMLGGSVFYGGLLGAIFVIFIYTRIKKLSFADYSDVGALAIPLFHFFGRIGCFCAGCCYGVEWEHGFTFHHAVSAGANGVARFPVQLVEAGLNLVLFFVLYYLYKKGKANHRVLIYYLLTYPVYRFILEFFRDDTYRGFVGFMSTSQFISVVLFAVGLICLIVSNVKKKHTQAG